MTHPAAIAAQSDSLIELLAEQCADLENLLILARRETAATEQLDFEEVMRVVGERAALGDRLEVYHRQIAEMRTRLGEAAEQELRGQKALHAVSLIAAIKAQDACTRPLMTIARDEASTALARLGKTRRGVDAYLRDGRPPTAFGCDQHA